MNRLFKISTLILASLLWFPLISDAKVFIHSGSHAQRQYCAACPDPDPMSEADEVCEALDSSTDGICGWTIWESGGDTGDINMAGTPDNAPALGCTNIPMTYSINYVKANTTPGGALAYIALSTATEAYGQSYVKIISESLANTNFVGIFKLQNTSTTGTARIELYQNSSGNLRFRMGYHVAAGWLEDEGGTTISTDTWYGLRIKLLDPAGGGSDSVQWWVDYANDGTWTDEGTTSSLTLDRALAYGGVGDEDTIYVVNYQVVGVKFDDDTMPVACAR